jgi:hypothetical protein
MKQSQIMQALQVALTANVPVILWGEPGGGKTASVNAVATALGWPIETVLASLREPSDFAGLPVIIDKHMHLAPPDWAGRLAGQPEAICFLDEISTAAPATQRALLRVIHERVAGDLNLGHGVRMVAAANPADIAAGGWDLTPPLANRFLHLYYEIDPAVVAAGLLGAWPEADPLSISPDWASHLPHYRSVVSGFLSARPGMVHDRPKNREQAGLAWPSPRSWEAVISILAASEGTAIAPEARLALIAGLVGEGAAVEFLSFERDLDLPNPESLLANPTSYARPPRGDQVHAVIAAVTFAVRNNLTAPRWTAAMEVFAAVAADGNVDIAANGVRQLAALRPENAVLPTTLKVFREILVAAGLLAAPPTLDLDGSAPKEPTPLPTTGRSKTSPTKTAQPKTTVAAT